MFSAVRSQHRGVDICINNAGMARPDTLLSGSTSGWKDMFNVRLVELGQEAGGRGSEETGHQGLRRQRAPGDRTPVKGSFSFPRRHFDFPLATSITRIVTG